MMSYMVAHVLLQLPLVIAMPWRGKGKGQTWESTWGGGYEGPWNGKGFGKKGHKGHYDYGWQAPEQNPSTGLAEAIVSQMESMKKEKDPET